MGGIMENETPNVQVLTAEELKERNDSRRTQLSFLQTRISLHGNRMWQLPLTYIGSLALAVSAVVSKDIPFPKWWIFSAIFLTGFVVLWCMYGAFEGYRRTADDMCRVENELDLKDTTRSNPSHIVPYFLLIIAGMLFSLIAGLYVYATLS
jgi:Flp pilus assembly protein TadB